MWVRRGVSWAPLAFTRTQHFLTLVEALLATQSNGTKHCVCKFCTFSISGCSLSSDCCNFTLCFRYPRKSDLRNARLWCNQRRVGQSIIARVSRAGNKATKKISRCLHKRAKSISPTSRAKVLSNTLQNNHCTPSTNVEHLSIAEPHKPIVTP